MRRSRVLPLLLLLGGSLVALPQAAQAAPPTAGLPAGYTSWAQVMAAQEPLNTAGLAIRDAAATNPASGYSNHSIDVVTRTLTLYWKGTPSGPEAGVLDAAKARGIKVVVHPARYSATEVEAKRELILRDAQAARIARVSPATDGSGITVSVRPAAGVTAFGAGVTPGADAPNLRAAVRAGGVTVVTAEPAQMYTREADSAPFYAGGLIMRDGVGGPACTAGWSVRFPNNEQFTATARHCGALGSNWYSGDGHYLGWGAGESITRQSDGKWRGYDALFVVTTGSGGSDSRMFDGPGVFQANQFQKLVRGTHESSTNSWVCMSPAVTGVRCSIQIVKDNDSECVYSNVPGIADGTTVCFNTISALSRADEWITMAGDSGGPVFVNADNNTNVYAAGIIHGSYGQTGQCANPLYGHYGAQPSTVSCSRGVSFTSIRKAMAPFSGLQVNGA
ncbi:hypothetical protein Daura_24395 [Dactylosporangium aurantiacum]|uniref:Streptogrisin C n=1 Tax=Dactylosporangium aurantiacum TaxID=35754 RepID=A0A9Q9MS07_9ACTN|nr:hypothetical protein [Dactylosporangium aurantiacum]MDG6103765.1 hypothetical protein [Dactylosporangium aurantiacum]UWZ59022.1 hypothetical protein Daura_24395 [Dactylosporangium aurantiacum]